MIKLLITIVLGISLLYAGDEEDLLRRELAEVKAEYERKRDSLESKTVQRWRVREESLKEGAEAKERADALRQELEDLFNSVSLFREENYSYKNRLADLEQSAGIVKERNLYSRETILKHLNNAEKSVLFSFPLNQQERMKALNTPLLSETEKRSSAEMLEIICTHHLNYLNEGRVVTAQSSSIVTSENELVEAYTLRFGNFFAYGVEEGDSARTYYLSGNGDEDAQHFSWRSISLFTNSAPIETAVISALGGNELIGSLPVDLTNQLIFLSPLTRKHSFKENVEELVKKGGITMYPLLGIVLWALVIIFLKLTYFGTYRLTTLKTRRKTTKLIKCNSLTQLSSFLSVRKDRLARIGAVCLKKGSSREEKEELVREELLKESPHLERGLGTLAVLASSAPLLGLFGTVTGMIRMFDAITQYGTGDPKLLAGGISEALITTEVGLAIAIPLLLVHNFLRNRKRAVVLEIEIVVQQLLNRMYGGEDE